MILKNFLVYLKNNYNKKKQILTHFIFQNKNIDKVVVGFENSTIRGPYKNIK